MQKKNLFSGKELFFVFFISGCLITFSLLSWLNSSFFSYLPPKKICIEIRGAVKNPGKFFVYPGAFVQKILRKAKPLKEAEIFFEKGDFVKEPRVIEVPFRTSISVFVSGALENPGVFKLPAGSTLGSLYPFLHLKKDAYIKKNSPKKILKHEEQIVIPAR